MGNISSSAPATSPNFDPSAKADTSYEPSQLLKGASDSLEQAGIAVSSELKEIALTWLSWQCRMVSGILSGALFLPDDDNNLSAPIAQWPELRTNTQLLSEVALSAQAKKSRTTRTNQPYGVNKGQTCDLLACPLIIDEQLIAVVSLMISPRSKPQRHAVIQLLEWGMQWLESLLRQEAAARQKNGEMSLQLLSALLQHDNSKAAAIEAVNILAQHIECERVSIGFFSGLSINLVALSHVSHFDPASQLVREIEAVMNESVDQKSRIIYSSDSEPPALVVQAHAGLAKHRDNANLCTIPLRGKLKHIGALTCEHEHHKPFTHDDIVHCETVARLIGPVIELMLHDERSFMAKGRSALQRFFPKLFGLTYLKLKLTVLAIFLSLFGLSIIQAEYQVKSSASLQGKVRQLLVSPQDGYVSKSMAAAGDLVEKDNVLATLDSRTLQLERQKWQSESNKLKKQHQQAFSERERTQLGILQAQIDQVTAEIQLIDEKIARTILKAPFDGVIVSGDLSQSQGAPVALGQVLFEVTPLHSYRVMLEVDEHDVAALKQGQTGQLILSAIPQTTFAITLERVIPVAISKDGYNYFRVEAQVEQPSALLRPGMRGVAKIAVEQRDLLWVWSHDLLDRIRMWWWAWGLV